MTKDGDKRFNSGLLHLFKTGISENGNTPVALTSYHKEFEKTENNPSNKYSDIQLTEHFELDVDKRHDEKIIIKTSTIVDISRERARSTKSSSGSYDEQKNNRKVNSSSLFLSIRSSTVGSFEMVSKMSGLFHLARSGVNINKI